MLFEFSVRTSGRNQFLDITSRVREALDKSGVTDGVAIVFVPHTTAGVTINENADPDVLTDMVRGMGDMVPENSAFRHSEGNSTAHIKSTVTGPSLTLIVTQGRLLLGTWQGVYFCEYDGPRNRRFHVKVMAG